MPLLAERHLDITDPGVVFAHAPSSLQLWQRDLLRWAVEELIGVSVERAELIAYTPFFDMLRMMLVSSAGIELPNHELFREISRLRQSKHGQSRHGQSNRGRRESPLMPLDARRLGEAKLACLRFADGCDPARAVLRGPARSRPRSAA